MQPYDSRVIANTFLHLASEEGNSLSHLQIQKMAFFAHGWSLAHLDMPLVGDHIEAWTYGPVFPYMYDTFKIFGGRQISSFYRNELGRIELVEDSIVGSLIKWVYNEYKRYSAEQLSEYTHQHGTPWHTIKTHGSHRDPIPNDLIRDYFSELRRRKQLF